MQSTTYIDLMLLCKNNLTGGAGKRRLYRRRRLPVLKRTTLMPFIQFCSPRCWLTVGRAREVYRGLGSKAARVVATAKEQILIRQLGLGWEEAHHAWSEDGVTFMSGELLKWLMNVVIPMANDKQMPMGPPIKLPKMPDMKQLGTTYHLVEDQWKNAEEKLKLFKMNAILDIDRGGEGGRGSVVRPAIKSAAKNWRCEGLQVGNVVQL